MGPTVKAKSGDFGNARNPLDCGLGVCPWLLQWPSGTRGPQKFLLAASQEEESYRGREIPV